MLGADRRGLLQGPFHLTKIDEVPLDRIREYLGRLSSRARSNLLAEIERIQLYGDDIPGSETILTQLRAEFRTSGESHDRVGNPSRHFFKPIEALFVDRSPERANSGEISRGSVSAIWEWFNQVLLPTMARDYCDRMKLAIAKNDPKEIALLAAAFQSKVVKCLEGFLAADSGVDAARTGLGQYTSSRASYNDLTKVLAAMRVRDAIVAFSDALPPEVKNFKGDVLNKTRGRLDAFAAKHPEAIPFALTIVAKRLKTRWQFIRLATEIARSRKIEDIKETRYAICISMVLDHLDERRLMLGQALKSNRIPLGKTLLANIYDIEDALRAGIERLDKSDWGQRLDELLAMVAADVKAELETLPEHTQHVLGSRARPRLRAASALVNSLIHRGRDLIGFSH
jgi:hypothetical protein